MIFLIIWIAIFVITVWTVLVLLVIGLCYAARLGDQVYEQSSSALSPTPY